jgi:predicted TIM-barrel fold metal-dependent hydrolase
MTGALTDFEVWDADNHFYEPVDALTRHLPKQYRGAIEYVEVRGRTKIAVRNRIVHYIPNPTFEVVAAPGVWEDYFRGRNTEGKSLRELTGEPIRCRPEFRNPEDRLRLLDQQGITAAQMFPTLVSLVEERMKDDIELTHAVIHAFNQWLFEDWSFNFKDRIFPVPVITLPDVRQAIAELEWCLERGARTVLIRPAPVPMVNGRSISPGVERFDPFWRRVQEAGIPVMMHASDSGYDVYTRAWDATGDEWLPFEPTALSLLMDNDSRPIVDTLSAVIAHGLFARHPGLRVGVIENGARWVPRLLENLDHVHHKSPRSFAEPPVETFRRHVWVHPFHEDDITALASTIGADHVLFGSDFPHPEGLREPLSFVDDLADLAPDDVRRVMGQNLRDLLEPQPAGA